MAQVLPFSDSKPHAAVADLNHYAVPVIMMFPVLIVDDEFLGAYQEQRSIGALDNIPKGRKLLKSISRDRWRSCPHLGIYRRCDEIVKNAGRVHDPRDYWRRAMACGPVLRDTPSPSFRKDVVDDRPKEASEELRLLIQAPAEVNAPKCLHTLSIPTCQRRSKSDPPLTVEN